MSTDTTEMPRVAERPSVQQTTRGRRGLGIVTDLAVLALLTVGVTALYLWRSRSFFLMDDAQNEYLPYFADMGRQWLHGHVPVLTSRTILGGNYTISIERPIFAPQTILFSIIAATVHRYLLIATAFAATNIFLTAVGGWFIGRVLRLGRVYSVLLGMTVATVPVFVFMYAADWWNAAIATVWTTWAVAALLYAIRRPSVRASVLLGLATLLLLVSAWPHGLIGLLVIAACLLLAHADVPGGWRRILRDGAWRSVLRSWLPVLVPLALAALVSIPVFSEFVQQRDLVYRFNEISNDGNFCVPTLDQTLGVMNPVASTYWNCWGGYTNWPLPIGFVSILTTVAFVFWRPARGDRTAWALIASAVALLLLSQLPSTVSSTHYPFRFLPIAGLVVGVLIFHLMRNGVRRVTPGRIVVAAVLTFASAFIGVSRAQFPGGQDVLYGLLFVVLTAAGMVAAMRRSQRLRNTCFSVLTLAGIVLVALQGHGLATRYLYFDPLLRNVQLTAEQQDQLRSGYVAIAQMPNDIASAGSARSLLLDWRSFNGYDPVGQKAFMQQFGNHSTQGFYDAGLLQTLAQPADVGTPGVCDFEVYGVRSVIAQADLDPTTAAALEGCGFTRESTVGRSAFWAADTGAVGAALTYADPGIVHERDSNDSERSERAMITANPDGGTVTFARIWWPGYSATLDGRPVTTSSYRGVLTSVELPPGATGELKLTYTPQSWRWSLPASGVGVVLAGAAVAWVLVRRRRTPAPQSVSDR